MLLKSEFSLSPRRRFQRVGNNRPFAFLPVGSAPCLHDRFVGDDRDIESGNVIAKCGKCPARFATNFCRRFCKRRMCF